MSKALGPLSVSLLCLGLLGSVAQAAPPTDDLPRAFADAAAEHGVPESVLLALAWEASHWRVDAASAWGGHGLFDLRDEPGGGPTIEWVSRVSGLGPADLLHSPRASVRGAAALLAQAARASNGGVLPPVDDLMAWDAAMTAFSGSDDPRIQGMYVRFLYEALTEGVPLDAETGLSIIGEDLPLDWVSVPPPPTACDYAGCYQFIAASSANYSNYSRTAADIGYVVVHTTQGSYSGTISWFQNSSASVSAHYVVRSSDGQVTQMVLEEDVGWHAGSWSYNLASVGIEHEGWVDEPEVWYTDAMYTSSAALTADICARNGISLDRAYIIGHVEVPGATHTDPGTGWDWSYYMDLINTASGGGGSATADVIGVVADTDIYSGARIVGASVWVEETGETVATDADGYYHFYDLPAGAYTIHACADGYDEGTCTKDLTSGETWCSIALVPGTGCSGGGEDGGGGDTGTTDGGGDDTAVAGDGGGGDDGSEEPGTPDIPAGSPPGQAVPMDDVKGGCAAVGDAAGPSAALLAGLLALGRRRRRG